MKKLMLIIVVFSFLFPIQATDVDFYSEIKLGTWWLKTERFYDDSIGLIFDTNAIDSSIDTSTNYAYDSLSPFYDNTWYPVGYVGFQFKADRFEGCIEFGVEYSLYDVELYGSTTTRYVLQKRKYTPKVNKWYATWHIVDILSLKIGQDYTPATFFQSNKSLWYELDYANIGCLYTGPKPMFHLSLHDRNSLFELEVAALKTDTALFLDDNVTYDQTAEVKTPKIEFAGNLNLDKDFFAINCKLAGGFQKYTNVTFNPAKPADSVKTDIKSYVFGADLGIKLGPVFFIGDVFYGQNLGPYGVLVGDPFGFHRVSTYMHVYFPIDTAVEWGEPTEFTNSKATQISGILKFKPLDWLSFEGGYGVSLGKHEFKQWDDIWDPTHAWYFQTELKIVDQITITPELGQYIYGPKIGFGRKLYWGFLIGAEF